MTEENKDMSNHVSCKECGTTIEESCDSERKPCPRCESMHRVFDVEIKEEIKMYDSLSSKHKNPKKTGKSKILSEGFNGYEYSHRHQKMVAKQRLIDREGDAYREIITDIETGEVIHKCEEPLSQHTSHGTAKPRPKDES
ncbi:MAG: hypothetical protein Q7J68_08260 [Thermoplasmata archaeon]|nr:hypothetical protein [Thermoplasmata archaeon]